MKVKVINQEQKPIKSATFKAIYISKGANKIVKKLLSPSEREEIKQIIKEQKNNHVDIFISKYKKGSEQLTSKIVVKQQEFQNKPQATQQTIIDYMKGLAEKANSLSMFVSRRIFF